MQRLSPRLIVAACAVLVVAIFVVQNHDRVTVGVLLWDVTLPRSLLIALVFATGYVAGWLTRSLRRQTRT